MVGVAQSVRAPDCGSGGRGFNSRHSPHAAPPSGRLPAATAAATALATPAHCPVRLTVRTPGFQPGNTGSIPVRGTRRPPFATNGGRRRLGPLLAAAKLRHTRPARPCGTVRSPPNPAGGPGLWRRNGSMWADALESEAEPSSPFFGALSALCFAFPTSCRTVGERGQHAPVGPSGVPNRCAPAPTHHSTAVGGASATVVGRAASPAAAVVPAPCADALEHEFPRPEGAPGHRGHCARAHRFRTDRGRRSMDRSAWSP